MHVPIRAGSLDRRHNLQRAHVPEAGARDDDISNTHTVGLKRYVIAGGQSRRCRIDQSRRGYRDGARVQSCQWRRLPQQQQSHS